MPSGRSACPHFQAAERNWVEHMSEYYTLGKRAASLSIPPEAGDSASREVRSSPVGGCLAQALKTLVAALDNRRRQSNKGLDTASREALLTRAVTTSQAALNWVHHVPHLYPTAATMQGLCVVHSDSCQIADVLGSLLDSAKESSPLPNRAWIAQEGTAPARLGGCPIEEAIMEQLEKHLAGLKLETAKLTDMLREEFQAAACKIWASCSPALWRLQPPVIDLSEGTRKVVVQLLTPLQDAMQSLDPRTSSALFPQAVCSAMHAVTEEMASAMRKSSRLAASRLTGEQLRADSEALWAVLTSFHEQRQPTDTSGSSLAVVSPSGLCPKLTAEADNRDTEPPLGEASLRAIGFDPLQAAASVFKRAELIAELLSAPRTALKEPRGDRDWASLPDAERWQHLRKG
mmetsp:Transcript_15801/g.44210  ORF Transcript_15801/g.44210 Transcript_15801/m.44210 type:complete len:403 (+) Transcript_15801:1720-2928(+)